jgi:hypothetical protein
MLLVSSLRAIDAFKEQNAINIVNPYKYRQGVYVKVRTGREKSGVRIQKTEGSRQRAEIRRESGQRSATCPERSPERLPAIVIQEGGGSPDSGRVEGRSRRVSCPP